ncbi:ParM/StbA family protein [Desulfotomaculum sp. OF05-3]|jgi:hypothetical protein|uniref:ParM/StbA family protein n=1 Tax=Desulfotomaculum sp. OF05-3 TaxID=2305243 RepID=UPI000E41FC78|nr:ParM/StbA family protein [Desulfotomaculum sp. OF05-3]RGE17134.1 ParM/StbA family protein [Desulfotomaculum sp. OF05-3]
MNLKPLQDFSGEERSILGLFGIDVGNHDTKSRHTVFASGYKKDLVLNKLATEYIEIENNGVTEYYTPTLEPFNFANDKTATDEMWILSLFSIAKEAIARGISISNKEGIVLAIGMPPGDFNEKNAIAYKEYYRPGSEVKFYYKNIPFDFIIEDVFVTAQCWGAAAQYKSLIKGLNDVYFIDIGGITTDVMRMVRNQIQSDSIDSYKEGVKKLFMQISKQLRSETGNNVSPLQIADVLSGKDESSSIYVKFSTRIHELAYDWLKNLFTSMITAGAEFSLTPVVTLGGGPLLLEDELRKVSSDLGFYEWKSITDNRANAIGYESIAAVPKYKIKKKALDEYWAKFDWEHKESADEE